MNRKGKDSTEVKVEPKVYLNYNPIRYGVYEEVKKQFNTPEIKEFEAKTSDSVTVFLKEFEEDTAVPTDLDLLYNFNASLNVIESKWLRRHDQYSKALDKHSKMLETLKAKIIYEYKRNPDAHNGLLLSDKEIANIILMNDDFVNVEQKIANLKAIISVVEKALARIDGMSYRINNAINALKIKHELQW